jgi:hypothetical protein
MSLKSFFIKKALQMKGISSEEADRIAKQISDNPEVVESLKAIESNKEVKELFDKITKEIDEKKKAGLDEKLAAVLIMGKYKAEIMKYRQELMPLMNLMQGMQGKM